MTTPRRGTALFNILLGYPEPKPAPIDLTLPMLEWRAAKLGLTTATELTLDEKLFTIIYWPRPDYPYCHTYDQQKLVNQGCKFFDYKIAGEIGDSTAPTFSDAVIWYPESQGALEMQIVRDMLNSAYHYRQYNQAQFAAAFGQDPENDHVDLRYRFCRRCENYFVRIGIDRNRQTDIYQQLYVMQETEGVQREWT